MSDVLRTDDMTRIRFNIGEWSEAGLSGTYRADAIDYGNLDVAILRDIRLLVHRVDELEAELATRPRRPTSEYPSGRYPDSHNAEKP